MSPRAFCRVTVLGDQEAAASICPEIMAVVIPSTVISTVLISSMVMPARARACSRIISEEVPEDTATVLPFRSSMVSMPLALLPTTTSDREVV